MQRVIINSKNIMSRSAWLVILLFLAALPARAQDLNETLSQVGEAYARAYVDPLAEVLGSHLNTGLFHTAGTSRKAFGVDVYIGVKGSASLLTEAHRTFNLVYQSTVPLDVDFAGQIITMDVPATFTVSNAPSVFGDETEGVATISVDHDTTFSTLGLTIPVSFDSTLTPQETIGGIGPLDVAPFAVPQIGLGTVFGTDVMVRWLPKLTATDIGSLELFGFGVRHNLNQYLPILPVDISIQAAWQRLTVDDAADSQIMNANTFAVNLAVSKRIGVLTVYGGVQSERSDISFSYVFDVSEVDPDIDADPIDVDFTLTRKGRTRGIFGLGLKLGPFVWNADVNVGKITIYSTGIGFAF